MGAGIESVETFDFSIIENLKEIKRRGSSKKHYLDIVLAFDIETTLIEDVRQSVMYIWQMQLGPDHTVIGRTWDEFRMMVLKLNEAASAMLICYVHNLSYEFQFIKSIIDIDDVFAMDRRKVLYCRSGNIEFRCSYLLSNMTLEKFCISAGSDFRKQSGFDYAKKRFPWTELNSDELNYCIYDVKALESAIRNKMQKDGDTLLTIPLTSTGYVRRIFRDLMRPYDRMVKYELPDLEVFQGLRKAFRGGNTHANRYYSGSIVEDVWTYDISSSYPAVLLTERYPGRFEKGDPAKLSRYIKDGWAVLIHMNLYDVKLSDDAWGCPYLSKHKCDRVFRAEIDNGRVLKAETCTGVWMTEIDLEILCSEYDFKFEIVDLYISRKKMLPAPFRAELIRLYQQKTKLKGVDAYLYGKIKNQFNSAYGMSVQNPCRPDFIFTEDREIIEDESVSLADLIQRYHERGWLPYQIGVWCTAYARQKLEAGIKAIDPDRFIYADTDSVKCIGNADQIFDSLNRKFRNQKLKAKDKDGKWHYIGIYESEGKADRFITMGAKKYAYEDERGLHVTISGVNKKAGAEELKSLDNFKKGFVFREAGGMEALYNDQPAPDHIEIEGHELKITSNVALMPSTYTLGVSPDYSMLLNFLCNTDIRFSLHYER